MVKKTTAIFILLNAFPLLAYPAFAQNPGSSHAGSAILAKTACVLTAVAGSGGTVTPGHAKAAPGLQKHVKSFTFSPAPWKGVQSITGSYQSNTTFKYVNALTGANIDSLPAPAGVKVKVVITNVTGDAFLSGAFAALAANAGASQVVLTGASVTLDGSLSTGAGTYAWTQVSGPAPVTLSGASTSIATFTAPALAGTYVFSLTHGTSATTTVYVSDSVAQIAKSECVLCHAGQRVGAGVYTNWSASAHRQITVLCYGCHVGANTGTHPGTVNDTTVDPTTFVTKVAGVNGTLPQGAIFCTYCHTGNKAIPHPTTGQALSCVACHGGGTDAHTIQKATQAPIVDGGTDCSKCHATENTNFAASKHWNNDFEYSGFTNVAHTTFDFFFDGPPTTVPAGQLPTGTESNIININPNESWNTYEWSKSTGGADGKGRPSAPVTCSANCHFKARTALDVTGCNACHSGGLKLGGAFKNGSSAHKTPAYSSNTCKYCHYSAKGTGHGQTTVEFNSSRHATNPTNVDYNQVVGTTQCAYACHFKPNLGPLGNAKQDVYAINRPGYDDCVNCHDPHKPTTTARNTCFECHKIGTSYGAITANYTTSVHNHSAEFHPTEETLYNSSTFKIVKADCLACHNPHKPEQTTATTSSLTGYTDLNPCAVCHNGISATTDTNPRLIKGKVHFTSASSSSLSTAYVGNAGRPRNSCTQCHMQYDPHSVANFTNNSAAHQTANWADSAHGKLTGNWTSKLNDHMFNISDLKPGTTTARSTRGLIEGTTTAGYFCVRCHTANGFAQFVTADAKHAVFSNISAVDIKYGFPSWTDAAGKIATANSVADSSPLLCSACHVSDAKGFTRAALRSVPAAKGFYNVSGLSNSSLTSKVYTTHQFADLGESNLCVPCHAGVSGTAEAIDAVFAATPAYNGSLINPHHGMAAAHVTGYGLYTYSNMAGIANTHMTVGTGTRGPCVGCHFSKTTGNHSLEAIDANLNTVSTACAGCHGANFNVTTARANFDASLIVLKNLLLVNGLPTKRAAPAAGKTWATAGPVGGTAAKNMGASLNYYVLYSARTASNPSGGVDAAGYVHNPNYVKKVIADTIDYLAHGSVTGSITDVLADPARTAGLTASQVANLKFGLGHATGGTGSCTTCHVTGGTGNVADCVGCHSIPQNAGTGFVQDNNGVRAITGPAGGEFAKRSHHITGATPTNAQCCVCHLEGTADAAGNIVFDYRYHMKDARIYLRDVDSATGVFAWDGTNHSTMDNFCFACHDSNGAADIATLQTLVPNATSGNPFGDSLTNSYDQVTRAKVVDVKSAFATANASHHAVSGQRYIYRFSTRVNADSWSVRHGGAAGDVPDSQIAEFNPTAVSPLGGTIEAFDAADPYDPVGPEKGGEATLYEADKFVSSYIPLGASATVGDNSTLHCGDCHTVGQWKAGSSTNADGSATGPAIGAHGSANEYLLRNSLGSDALHSGQTYVCFNCHKTDIVAATDTLWDELVAEGKIASTRVKPTWKAGWNALHPNVLAGQVSGYATAHAVSAFHVNCQADSSWTTGTTNRLAINLSGNTDRTLDYLPAAGATAVLPASGGASGNITGIACTNCHNSGLRSSWGGIHGGNNVYTDGLGRIQTTYRFMPGMGNYRYAPPGGWNGRDTSDSTLVTQAGAGVGAGKPMGGCYTNSALTGSDPNTGYGACSHHGTSTAQTTAGGQAAGFRTTYGGGTASTPTASEPTVREATAGGTLVTRPLKY